jgi:spermidine synthase
MRERAQDPDTEVAPTLLPWRRAALLALFFCSGAAALIYQVLWLKELGLLFGVTAYAAATTLAVFFLGLATGSYTWGRRSAGLRNPLRTYGWLEVGVALTAGLYFWLLNAYQWLYPRLFALLGHQPVVLLAVKFALAMGILLPPAFFMGGTLPVMGQYLIRSADRFGRTTTILYAVNTLGAASGALLAGFYLPAVLGFRNSYLLAMALNLAIAGVTLWWSRTEVPGKTDDGDRRTVPVEPRRLELEVRPWLVWTIAIASGLLTLALEVLWTRMFAQVLQNSVYTFAAILTVFLVALGLGSLLAHLLCRAPWPPTFVLFTLLAAAGLLVATTPPLFYRLTDGLQLLGEDLGWTGYLRAVFGGVAGVILLPGLVVGSVFPYLMKVVEARVTSAGETIGRLASVNTMAAIAGSLLAGFVLLDWIGLWRSVQLLALAYLFVSLVVLLAVERFRGAAAVLPALAVVAISLAPQYGTYAAVKLDIASGEELVELREGAHGTVAVVRRGDDLRLKVNNSYLLGTSASTPNLRLQSWIPLSLHPDPASVFFLGMGTGITAAGALDFEVEEVIVTELNPDVVETVRAHFEPFLNGLFEDPRAEVVVEDGRAYLAGSRQSFDVIVADIFLTYRAGVGSLYSKEHFETVRARLAPGGIFAQWLPMFELSEREFGTIARTMLEVFPQVTVWRRGFSPRFPLLALVGQESPAPLDSSAFARRLTRVGASLGTESPLWFMGFPFAAYTGDLSAADELVRQYPVANDDRPLLEYLSPVTHREARGNAATRVLAWDELAALADGLLSNASLSGDSFLEQLTEAEAGQVWGGLELYKYETARRLGRDEEARRRLESYRRLLGMVD